MRRPIPIVPGPDQESVWDYPRPPRLEAVSKRLRVIVEGVVLAETLRGFRTLETSHPPVYYFPPEDVQRAMLERSARRSFCEWKGQAVYYHIRVGHRWLQDVAWSYPVPTLTFAPLVDHLAFYSAPMDGCYVEEERVTPQPGIFYGGWITTDIVGPFKGEVGSEGW